MEETKGPTTYELSYLLKTGETDAELMAALKQHGAEVSAKTPAPVITLAYPIKKHSSAQFGSLKLTVPAADAIKAISDALNLKDSVLRFLFVKIPKSRRAAIASAKAKEGAAKKAAAAAESELSNEKLEQTLEEILK